MYSSVRSSLLLALLSSPVFADDLGLKIPPGFKVTQFADEKLANDIYAMTLDAKGRVVVTSRGWVKRLEDTNNDGKADKATIIAETKTGGMGLLFDDDSLFVTCDGGLMRYELDSSNPDEKYKWVGKWFDLAFTEHGGHAIRQGPDGRIYVIAGNNAGLQKYPAFKNTEGGGILRFKNKEEVKLIAHGFRNAYDFDFTPLGDIITYDSDTERDDLLPWYTPTRLFHVAIGQHHGYRQPGYNQTLSRPDYYPDAVEPLANIGRGSPTGVVCYRHYQFPKHYRGGVFLLDWTFGKIYYCPLTPEGSTYKTKPEIFLESTGNNGFAPTDICVAPDGSLLISIGGRGTRGSVYRVEYVGDGQNPLMPMIPSVNWIDQVLDAPQPLDAWSKTKWLALAKSIQDPDELIWRIGFHQLAQEVANQNRSSYQRIRALEIVQDQPFNPIGKGFDHATKDPSAELRERGLIVMRNRHEAWDRGDYRIERTLKLTNDSSPRVRSAVLEILKDHLMDFLKVYPDQTAKIIADNLASTDRRLRMQAMQLVTEPDPKFDLDNRIFSSLPRRNLQAKLLFSLMDLKNTRDDPLVFFSYLPILESTNDPEVILTILRLGMIHFGDWCLKSPPAEVYAPYTFQNPPQESSATLRHFTRLLRDRFPSKDFRINREITRFLAMIQDNDPGIVNKLLDQITPQSNPTDDVHYLIVLSRLQSPRTEEQTKRVASAILNLDKKFQGQQLGIKLNWDARLSEVLNNLLKQHPDLASEMVTHPDFLHPSHVSYALRFDPENRKLAAKFFYAALRKDPDFQWSESLVNLFAHLPESEYRPLFRKQWNEYGLRDSMLIHLAKKPEAIDRERFLWGLESSQTNVIMSCLKALKEVPLTPEQMVPIFKLLRQSCREPNHQEIRSSIMTLLNHHLKQSFSIKESSKEIAAIQKDYEPIFVFLEKNYPKQYQLFSGVDDAETAKWDTLLRATKWDKGDAQKGAKLFQNRSCATCHEGSSRIGPDLGGVTNRFSRDDIFTAIIDPDRDVAPAFRAEAVHLHDGKIVHGIVIFEAADGIIVQLDATNTMRIGNGEIASRRATNRSMMPKNLLADLKSEDLANLYQYLQTLKAK
jgi:putative heme-binding domain-containing protein